MQGMKEPAMKQIVEAIEINSAPAPSASVPQRLLGAAQPGFRGSICRIDAQGVASSCAPSELERRLLEMGFIEGHTVEVLHQGAFRGDPIAVRVGATTIALRRREAMAVVVL